MRQQLREARPGLRVVRICGEGGLQQGGGTRPPALLLVCGELVEGDGLDQPVQEDHAAGGPAQQAVAAQRGHGGIDGLRIARQLLNFEVHGGKLIEQEPVRDGFGGITGQQPQHGDRLRSVLGQLIESQLPGGGHPFPIAPGLTLGQDRGALGAQQPQILRQIGAGLIQVGAGLLQGQRQRTQLTGNRFSTLMVFAGGALQQERRGRLQTEHLQLQAAGGGPGAGATGDQDVPGAGGRQQRVYGGRVGRVVKDQKPGGRAGGQDGMDLVDGVGGIGGVPGAQQGRQRGQRGRGHGGLFGRDLPHQAVGVQVAVGVFEYQAGLAHPAQAVHG